jgi:predicted nucleic acid-binding protein
VTRPNLPDNQPDRHAQTTLAPTVEIVSLVHGKRDVPAFLRRRSAGTDTAPHRKPACSKAHFVDCVIAATAVYKKVPVSTFDQDFRKFGDVRFAK